MSPLVSGQIRTEIKLPKLKYIYSLGHPTRCHSQVNADLLIQCPWVQSLAFFKWCPGYHHQLAGSETSEMLDLQRAFPTLVFYNEEKMSLLTAGVIPHPPPPPHLGTDLPLLKQKDALMSLLTEKKEAKAAPEERNGRR